MISNLNKFDSVATYLFLILFNSSSDESKNYACLV